MLRIAKRALADGARKVLEELQAQVDATPSYEAKVEAAKKAWDNKNSTTAKKDAFQTIRHTLAQMCIGPVRCAYCEDSLADEIEHIRPKNFFPDVVFSWENYLFSCGPCNGPKGSRYGVLNGDVVEEFVRGRKDPVTPPPAGPSALIDPRIEDPLDFLELDLGGATPDGDMLSGTFQFFPRDENISAADQARAKFTIQVLGLEREVMRVARENAFGGFRARLREYVAEKQNGASPQRLRVLQDGLLKTPHLTVFAEMRRQKRFLPEIKHLFEKAPEAEQWELTPP